MNKILLAFTSGIIIGILYAPSKGKNTRRNIANLGNGMKQSWNNVTDRVADKIEAIRTDLDDVALSALEKVESVQFDTPNKIV